MCQDLALSMRCKVSVRVDFRNLSLGAARMQISSKYFFRMLSQHTAVPDCMAGSLGGTER